MYWESALDNSSLPSLFDNGCPEMLLVLRK